MSQSGILYVVSTPIGNMGDFSFRAVETLMKVDAVLAEDTRHTRHLLDHHAVRTPLIAYHEHNEAKTTPGLITRLRNGASLALVSDAGTPLISDPGARLVRAAIEADIAVVPIPGPAAFVSALVASGLETERFTFFGFLPRSGSERKAALEEISRLQHTAVVYEAPGRLVRTLRDLEAVGTADRQTVVAREMTKQYEEMRRGTVGDLRADYEQASPKGEIVIVIGGAAPKPAASDADVREGLRRARAAGLSTRDSAAAVARELGVPRRLAYRLAQESSTEEQ